MRAFARPSAVIAVVTAGVLLFQFTACLYSGKPQKVPVTSNPSGARILVDGQDAGVTPLTLTLKRAADHKIRIEKDGCNPVEIVLVRKSRPGAEKVLYFSSGLLFIAAAALIGGLIGDKIDSADGESCEMEGFFDGLLIGALAGTGLVLLFPWKPPIAKLTPSVIRVTLEKTQAGAQARTNVIVLDRDRLEAIRWIRISCAEGTADEVVAVN